MSSKIIHIDMDCFYAAIEMRDDPSLRAVPIAVGGAADRRGVICTSNYLAREYGVRSAMSTSSAFRLCPHLKIIQPNLDKYREISAAIKQIFHKFTHLVEPLSLDEAYLDVTNTSLFNGSATLIAQEIRRQIENEQYITASAGIAPNKFLAKIASDWNKPNGQYVIPPKDVKDFVEQLNVTKIFGVGKVTAHKMAQLGITTCADLQKYSSIKLQEHFGKFGERLFQLCRGIDKRPVQPNRIRKSLSVEHTYPNDLPDLDHCQAKLQPLINELTKRLKNHQKNPIHKVFVKIKFDNFQQTTVECTTPEPKLNYFRNLLHEGFMRQNRPVRLLGVGVGFEQTSDNPQLSFSDF